VTEAEWDSCIDPDALLAFLWTSGKASERQVRLLCAACCDRIREEITERVAPTDADAPEGGRGDPIALVGEEVRFYRLLAADEALHALDCGDSERVALLRCVFGCPFQPPPSLDAPLLNWNDGAAVKLAQAIYEERSIPSGHLDAARLAVLADMLEEAGATDAQLLSHLRSAGPHVRGCFAVDAILGKS
jgi:hypothetical protein